ncbi:TIGR03067 domain-containing protein [Prosthecobacter sp.]|uniref:TIGR03067 domain-containing protein n=1 Tax=Prosthecobacter sp. TaxID=1965333 RepID=UPI00378302A3
MRTMKQESRCDEPVKTCRGQRGRGLGRQGGILTWLILLMLSVPCGRPAAGNETAGAEAAVEAERARLQGTWTTAEVITAGKKEALATSLEFKGQEVTIQIQGQAPLKGAYALDPSQSPATMEITFMNNGTKVVLPAIYQCQGDVFQLCHSHHEGEPRPTAFEAGEKSVLAVFKRKKP